MPGPEGLSDSYKRQIEEQKLGRDKIAEALAKAQGAYGVAERDTEGNFGDRGPDGKKKKFASLPSVWEACIPALSENEIATIAYTYWSIVSVPYDDGSRKPKKGEEDVEPQESAFMQLFIVVELVHSSGQKMSSELPIVPERQENKYGKRIRSEMQDIAAAKSFAKRQLFIDLAFANIAEDDHDTIDRNSNRGEVEDNHREERNDQNKVEKPRTQEEKKAQKTKEDFIRSCTAYHQKFIEADKEKDFIKIVNDAGYSSLKGITNEDDMATIVANLMEAAKKLPKKQTKKEEEDSGEQK